MATKVEQSQDKSQNSNFEAHNKFLEEQFEEQKTVHQHLAQSHSLVRPSVVRHMEPIFTEESGAS